MKIKTAFYKSKLKIYVIIPTIIIDVDSYCISLCFKFINCRFNIHFIKKEYERY